MPFSKKYELYSRTNSKNNEPVSSPGSMKNSDSKVEKDIFTSEEVDNLSPDVYDDPKMLKKIRKSMLAWKK